MARSENHPLKPTPLLALVALGVVHRLQPDWLAIDLQHAARQHGQSPERLSRLITRAIAGFEALLGTLTQRGRPPRRRDADDTQVALALTQALLALCTAILAHVSLRSHVVRQLIVGAWQRMEHEPGMTQARFCAALSLPARTLRAWLKRLPSTGASSPPIPPEPAEPKRPPPRRPPRRRRFGFDVTLPDTQIGADTTDVSAFGVDLKLIAAQDIGGRDERLFDAVLVDDHESSEHVVDVLGQALTERAGAQVITDQGTPYMAEQTLAALAALEVEHAAQREADPLGKSTVERAFKTVKSIADPLLQLTNRIAARVPALRDTSLAKGVTTLVITALLKAYQHGARAARAGQDARAGIDPETLARLARESRERARAQERSRRQLLAHIHDIFQFESSLRSFVNSLYRYPLTVLRDAERAFGTQAHRDDIRNRSSYFAALVRRFYKDWRTERERATRAREQDDLAAKQRAQQDATRAGWHSDPAAWLRHALELLALQWQKDQRVLLFDGAGLGLGWMRAALRRIVDLFGARDGGDIASGVLHAFLSAHDELGPEGRTAIETLLRRHLSSTTASVDTLDIAAVNASAILRLAGRNQRPSPSARLRI
jgi:hypothetical protein